MYYGGNQVNLSQKSTENVDYMIEKIKEKLKVLNIGAIKSSHFDEEMYEELKDIYDLVMKKIISVLMKCKQSLKN